MVHSHMLGEKETDSGAFIPGEGDSSAFTPGGETVVHSHFFPATALRTVH